MKFLILSLIATWSFSVFADDKIAPFSAALVEKGKASYSTNCLTCHGEKGDGMGPAGAYLNPKPRNFITDKFKAGESADKVYATITKGLPNTTMVAFGHLSAEDRAGLTYYILSNFKKVDFTKAKKK